MPLAPVIRAQVATDLIADDSTESAASQHFKPLIVPRHPQRFNEVQMLAESQGLSVSRRSSWPAAGAFESSEAMQADVWLGDSLGEMALYYGLSSVALLGGSFAPLGGQNLIEAAACGCPVVMARTPSIFWRPPNWQKPKAQRFAWPTCAKACSPPSRC